MAKTKEQQSGSKVPRYTSIMGQPHMLAYINSEEEQLLRDRGGMGIKGPGGILSYPPDSVIDADYDQISGGVERVSANDLTSGNNTTVTDSGSGGTTTTVTGQYDDPSLASGQASTEGTSGVVADSYIGKAISWLGGISDTDSYSLYGRRAVYTRENGTHYSYNILGLPYDISSNEDGTVEVDANGLPVDGTDYARIAELRSSGDASDQELADALAVSQAVNEEEALGEYNEDALAELLRESGMDASNVDIKAIVDDPSTYITNMGANLTDLVPTMDADAVGTNIDGNKDAFARGVDPSYTAKQVEDVVATAAPTAGTSVGYNEALIGDKVTDNEKYKVDGQQGTVSDSEKIDSDDYIIDMEGAATGLNADGSTNYTGQALNKYARQDFSKIIDTSTVSGKLLADKLGEGNYTDTKATIIGQMEIISSEFKDANGQPKIPTWAQGTARNIQKTIAFSGMTGTAATAALANALMESSLGVAEKEAAFFQTLTIENLDNRQEAFINKANVLSKFETANMDARENAAVTNAQKMFDMNLENLSNDQQAEVVNKKAAVDALFEDTKAKNAERLFSADAENDFKKYYDGLVMRANEATALAENEMKKFNAGEVNDASAFKAKIENERDQFYSEQQYNIDLSNAKWRRTVVETETEMKFDAASEDVKNILDLSQEGLNRMWDRVDSVLDYMHKTAENEDDRDRAVLVAQIQAQAAQTESNSSGGLFGFLGKLAGVLPWEAILGISDIALKENIRRTGTAENGLGLYEWDWTEEGKTIAKGQRPRGYLAQEVAETYPQAVKVGDDGHLRINYRKLPQ
jgi:hypothetical protein